MQQTASSKKAGAVKMRGRRPNVPVDTHMRLTTTRLADLLQISQPDCSRLTFDGKIPREPDGYHRLWPAVQAFVRLIRLELEEAKQRQQATTHKSRLEAAKADRAELEVLRQTGRVVTIDQVATMLAEMFSKFRQKYSAIPARAAPVLAVETEPEKIKEILDELINEALAELTANLGISGSGSS